jgi:hypothetical protein
MLSPMLSPMLPPKMPPLPLGLYVQLQLPGMLNQLGESWGRALLSQPMQVSDMPHLIKALAHKQLH